MLNNLLKITELESRGDRIRIPAAYIQRLPLNNVKFCFSEYSGIWLVLRMAKL